MKTIALALLLFLMSSPVFAFMKDYPPIRSFEEKPKPFTLQAISEEFQDGGLTVKNYTLYPDSLVPLAATDVHFEDKLIWSSKNEKVCNATVYAGVADLNGDGLKDVLVATGHLGSAVTVYGNVVTIFLGRQGKSPEVLQYRTQGFDAGQDILDMNSDGKADVFRCDFVSDIETTNKKLYAFWLYTIYELRGNQLVMNNSLRKIFPRFIRNVDTPNDNPSSKVSKDVQQKYVSSRIPHVISPK